MKKINTKTKTLDIAHTDNMNKFKKNEEVLIPKYKNEIENLEKLLNNYINKKNYQYCKNIY
jgi:hypothetical protein